MRDKPVDAFIDVPSDRGSIRNKSRPVWQHTGENPAYIGET